MHLSCILSVVRLRVGWAKRRKCVSLCDSAILCAGDTQVHQDYFGSKYPWNLKEPSPDALLFMQARVSTRSLWCQGASGKTLGDRKRRRVDGKQSEEEGQMWGSGKNIHYFLFLFAVSCEHSTSEHKTVFPGEPFCCICRNVQDLCVYIYILTVYYRITLIYIFMVKIICVLWHLQ